METDCWTPGFVNVAFSWEFLFSSMGATVTSPHFWTIYVESRAAFVPQAIFQPYCLIGNSETWENLSRITDSTMMFYVVRLFHIESSVFDSVKDGNARCSTVCAAGKRTP